KRLQDNTIWKINVQLLAHTKVFRADLQDKRIHHGFAAAVELIEYTDQKDGVRYTLERQNNVWRLRIPGQVASIVGEQQVGDILHAVEEMEWDSFTASTDQMKSK